MKSTANPQQKSYRKGSSLYFSAGLLLSMVLILTAFEWKFPHQLLDTPITPEDLPTIYEDEVKHVAIPAPPTPPKQGTEIEEIPNDLPTETEPPVELLPPDKENEMDENLLNTLFTGDSPFGKETTSMPEINRDAAPTEGYEAFYAYLYNNLRIPEYLLDRMGEERIVVSFVVDKDGQLTDLKIEEGFDKGMEKQVLKLLEEGPSWQPAWRKGSKVNSRKMLPIVIRTSR